MHNSHCPIVKSPLQLRSRGIRISRGDRVLVQGLFSGSVKYVGDLDGRYRNSQLYVGVKLDDPVGDTDGTYLGKRFFHCPKNHGAIVPIHHIHLLVSQQASRRLCTSFKRARRGRNLQNERIREQNRVGVLLQHKKVPDSNLNMSHTLPNDSSTLCDEATADSGESTTYEQNREVSSLKMISTAIPGALKVKEKLHKKGHCRRNKKKRKSVQGKISKVSVSSGSVEEIVQEHFKARSSEKETQTLEVIEATSSKEMEAQTSFNMEQRYPEMLEAKSCSDYGKESETMQVSRVDRATSPGLDGKHEGRFSIPSCEVEAQKHEEKEAYKEAFHGPDKSHEGVQSISCCDEETQTHQEKTEASRSTKDTQCTDGILERKVINDYVTVNDDHRTQKETELDHSSKCCAIADQVLAKMLREKLCSCCGHITEHSAMYENDIYIMAKQQDFRGKFDRTFVDFENTGSCAGPANVVKGVSLTLEESCCRCCQDKIIKSASEHSSLKFLSAGHLKRDRCRSLSSTDVSSTTPSFDAKSEVDNVSMLNERVGEDYESDSRIFMSGLGATPKSPSSELNGMKNIKKWTNVWGGREKGFCMAVTVQKLHDAMKKGMKEAEWQETLKMLKEEILRVSKMASYAEEQIERKLSSMKKTSSNSMNDLKETIEEQRKKNDEILERIYHHPMADNNVEYARNTITRITRDFKEGRDK